MLNTWTRWEKTGEFAVDAEASKASRSLRSDIRIVESSFEADGGVDGVAPATILVGEEVVRFGGDGVNGRLVRGAKAATGGLRAGSEEADGGILSESEAKALSRSFE
jgi:hypothetical protein